MTMVRVVSRGMSSLSIVDLVTLDEMELVDCITRVKPPSQVLDVESS